MQRRGMSVIPHGHIRAVLEQYLDSFRRRVSLPTIEFWVVIAVLLFFRMSPMLEQESRRCETHRR